MSGMMDWFEPSQEMRTDVLCYAIYRHIKTKYDEDFDLAASGEG